MINNNALSRSSVRKSALFIFATLFAACVTVNVHFPESSVQRAADDYVRELYQAKEKGTTKPGGDSAPTEKKDSKSSPQSRHFELNLLGTPALAASDFKVDSEKAREILSRQKTRINDIDKYKASGVLGESRDGLLFIKDSKKLKKLETKKVDSILTEENKDREALYLEIVESNGSNRVLPELVRKTFSRSLQNLSPAGTWIEDETGAWSKKD